MSIDPDIQFGDLQQEQPDVELRPDRNAHYAVAPYGEPDPDELPIFVDLDVFIEMESHALTDTSVELGGVMLGGQLHDEEGRPYVLVKDSVRAKHYEATKGSFKFTHDTWGQITREREEFPDDWDMVGWYHTHPDWGVFLSGMDMFICDHFFNKPLDVALVIDPCRQDRGFFQWTGDPRERKRRVSGFYVIASRHRRAELVQFLDELEGGYIMRTDPNVRAGYNVAGSGGGAPTIVNISEQRPGWMGQAIVGMLFVQTLVLLLVAYLALAPRLPDADAGRYAAQLDRRQQEIELKTAVLDNVLEKAAGPKEIATRLLASEQAAADLKDELLIVQKAIPQFKADLDKLQADLSKAESERDDWKTTSNKHYVELKELRTALAAVKAQDADAAADPQQPQPWHAFFTTPQGITILVVVLVFVGAVSAAAVKSYYAQNQLPEGESDEHSPEDLDMPAGEGDFRIETDGEATDNPAEQPPLRE